MDADKLTTKAAAAGLVLYVLGLLGVNAYLLPFGVTEFGVVKPQSIYTGVLVLLPLAVTALGVELVWTAGGALWSPSGPPRPKAPAFHPALAVRAAAAFAIGGLLAACAMGGILVYFGKVDGGKAWVNGLGMTVWSLLIVGMVARALQQTGEKRRRPRPGPPGATTGQAVASTRSFVLSSFGRNLCGGLILAALFTQYLGRFADDVYPSFPRQFGGGQPFSAHIVLTADAAAHSRDLGIPMEAAPSTSTGFVNVIFESADFYLLCLFPNGTSAKSVATMTTASRPPVGVEENPHDIDNANQAARDCIAQPDLIALRLDKRLVAAVNVYGHGR